MRSGVKGACDEHSDDRAGERDLRALAAIVSQDRTDLPAGKGLPPPSLLADLTGQIRCDAISVEHFDTGRQVHSWLQGSDDDDDAEELRRGLGSGVLDPLLGLPGLRLPGPDR